MGQLIETRIGDREQITRERVQRTGEKEQSHETGKTGRETRMDLAEIGSFDRSSLKREAQNVLEKSALLLSSESLFKYQSDLFYNLQLGNQFRCGCENLLRTSNICLFQ